MHGDALPGWTGDLDSALDQKLGIELVEVGADRVVGRMPVVGNTQPLGLLHGGANAVLVETLGSIGATAHARSRGMVAVGLELNITHLGAARSGWVTGVAVAVRLGGTVASYQVKITDEDGRTTATGRLTCLLRPA